MLASASFSPSKATPQTVLPMPSSLGSFTMRSAMASDAFFSAVPSAGSMASPVGCSASASANWWTATADARSPAAAPPMPSATISMVGET